MIIGVCGHGYSGSGAVIDLLKEYSDCKVLDECGEFPYAYMPDGLSDLEHHLIEKPVRYMSSDVAIKRFVFMIKAKNSLRSPIKKCTNKKFYSLSMEYVSQLVDLEWYGFWSTDFLLGNWYKRNIEFRLLNRTIFPFLKNIGMNKIIPIPPDRKMYLSVNPEMFFEKTKRYTSNLIMAISGDSKIGKIVLNQPFPSNCPSLYFHYYDDPYAIVVNRDPRDIYCLIKYVIKSFASWLPTEHVEDFVVYYRAMRKIKRINEDVDNKILTIQFEDLIYNFSNTQKCILDFCGLSNNKNGNTYFEIEKSRANTMIFKNDFVNQNDIQYIENELEKFLYDFDNPNHEIYNSKHQINVVYDRKKMF